MKACIVRFAGSNCDMDAYHVLKNIFKFETDIIWHKERFDKKYDVVILPGGFSYGDYLRPGAIAKFSAVMNDVKKHADDGGLTIGICNGFQILCESDLLPGVLLRNKFMKFICKDVFLKVNNSKIIEKMNEKSVISLPIAHADGNFYAKEEMLKKIIDNNQIILKYSSENGETDRIYNPNGSSENIAGICNEKSNVFGMMPHPERASEKVLGRTDGELLFNALFTAYGRF
ncbi:MAG: phosphoribosylformylglycinamidine synthase subunit PurQ [Candidatus Muiribacteriota bacterium]